MTTHTGLSLLSQREVAARLSVGVKTVERCRKATKPEGGIVRPMPGWRLVGRRWLIPSNRLDEWIEAIS